MRESRTATANLVLALGVILIVLGVVGGAAAFVNFPVDWVKTLSAGIPIGIGFIVVGNVIRRDATES